MSVDCLTYDKADTVPENHLQSSSSSPFTAHCSLIENSNVGTWAGPMNFGSRSYMYNAPVDQAERSHPGGSVAGEQREKGLCGLWGSVTVSPQASYSTSN